MKICCREVTALFNDTKFCDIATDLTTSEYGPADAGKRAEWDKTLSAFLFSLAYHSHSVIARSAGGKKALNHQSQTPLNRGLTAAVHLPRQRLTTLRPQKIRELKRTYTDGVQR